MAIIDEPIPTGIERLRAQHNDDGDYEAKACSNKLASSVWESISAFANTHGGTLLLGLSEEDGFSPTKGFDLDRVRDQLVSGMGDSGMDGAKISPVPTYEIIRVPFEDSQILAVRIQELTVDNKPCFIKARGPANGSYKRIDDKDVQLSPAELYEMQNVLHPSNVDIEPVSMADLSDLNAATIQGIIDRRRGSNALRGTTNDNERYARLHITDKKGNVLFTGLMVTGQYPQQFFPRLFVDVAVHPGLRKAESGSPRFLDRQQCDGPLPEAIEDAINATMRNLRTYSIVEGAGRRDVPEIPREVIREAIVNAVVHREYHPYFQGQPVSVDIYPDRVEITSPGGLWGGKTLTNLDNGVSACRNRALMQLLETANLPHDGGLAAEGQGSGIPLMIHEMESHALKRPEFKARADSFTVLLHRAGQELDANRQWIQELGISANSREVNVLLIVREMGTARVHDIHQRLKYDSDDIRHMLENLARQGIVSQVADDTYAVATPEDNEVRIEPEEQRTVDPLYESLSAQDAVLYALPTSEALTVRELAGITGKSLSSLRQALRHLVQQGAVTALGKPQSRSRKYRRAG